MNDEELDKLLQDKDSKSTKHVLKQAVDIFSSYCRARAIDMEQVEKDYTEQDLCECLRRFYAEVRRSPTHLY